MDVRPWKSGHAWHADQAAEPPPSDVEREHPDEEGWADDDVAEGPDASEAPDEEEVEREQCPAELPPLSPPLSEAFPLSEEVEREHTAPWSLWSAPSLWPAPSLRSPLGSLVEREQSERRAAIASSVSLLSSSASGKIKSAAARVTLTTAFCDRLAMKADKDGFIA